VSFRETATKAAAQFKDRKPISGYSISKVGRSALKSHLAAIESLNKAVNI
jgi:hypothetical protein